MPFIPKDERSPLALLARLEDEQASELSRALHTATDELDGDDLVQYVVDATTSIDAKDVKRILKAVRQIASAREVLEVQPQVFLNDIAEGMGEVEEKDLRLDEEEKRRLSERLVALTQSPAMEIHAKAESLRQDQQNAYCRARIVTDLRPIFGSDVNQSPRAVLVAHMLRITYHHGSRGTLRDLFLTLSTEDLDQLGKLVERAKSKAESLRVFAAAADIREIE